MLISVPHPSITWSYIIITTAIWELAWSVPFFQVRKLSQKEKINGPRSPRCSLELSPSFWFGGFLKCPIFLLYHNGYQCESQIDQNLWVCFRVIFQYLKERIHEQHGLTSRDSLPSSQYVETYRNKAINSLPPWSGNGKTVLL